MKKKKYYLLSVLILWWCLSLFEILSLVFVWPKPIYWRAWEYLSNYEGLDQSYTTFKPRLTYDGPMNGDLLNVLYFQPKVSDMRHQVFAVDEYGFRNRIGMLRHPIKAVILGSSFVAGAQETQKNLVSEILTDKYKLPTYNSANFIIQSYMEDSRFIKKPPKYLIFLGSEGELISAPFRYTYNNRNIITPDHPWSSYQEWKKAKEPFIYDFQHINTYITQYSMLRYLTNLTYVAVLNTIETREQLAATATSDMVSYEPETKMLFFQIDYDNPLLGSSGKTTKDIDIAIKQLQVTQELLKKRGTTLIVAAMPSKANLESQKYKKTPYNKRALVAFEKKLDRTTIEHVNLFHPMIDYMNKTKKHLYYLDDSHWNSEVNKILANLLAKKLRELESQEALE